MQVDSDTLEAKVIKLLMKGKPITLKEVARELHISERKIERVVKGLASRGIVEIEELPDKKYLRLKRSDISFHGTNPSQEKALKHKKSKRQKNKKKENRSTDMMYG
ncbi:MAG: helix-turn-helix transcriptional regulator [Thermoplasmatota archaeon]